MRVVPHVRVVRLQDVSEELVLRVVYGLDDKPVVAREVEKRAGLPGRAELGEDVFRGEGEEVVRGVDMEVVFAQLAEDPWRVVFELEVVLCRRRELVPDAFLVVSIRTRSKERGE